MNLIIVESPTKAKTISKFLGSAYKIESSYGHIRDLPKSKLGIDLEKNFEPDYIIPVKSRKVVKNLKEAVAEADKIILATDEDREGEAIAWHLLQALDLNQQSKTTNTSKPTRPKASRMGVSEFVDSDQFVGLDRIQRIVFHEITKSAIEEALKNPRQIDQNLVDAQQARRVLDRLVGYKLSPFLWKKVLKGLSAGRVQSVALRLIAERENEIRSFTAQEYWTIAAELSKLTEPDLAVIFNLAKINDKTLEKLEIKNQEEAEKIAADLKSCKFTIASVANKEVKKSPLPPFTTSSLQQESSKRLGYSAKKTMLLAQRLYENGYITYMRTDSVNLSKEAALAAKDWLEKNLGAEYAKSAPRFFTSKSRLVQEAHEAIRPTQVDLTSENLKMDDGSAKKLYKLIWQRFAASQMPEARIAATTIEVSAKSDNGVYILRASGQRVIFDGFLKVWPTKLVEKELPATKEGEEMNLMEVKPEQHFTEPPPRYTEASLIKTLEEYGIGRPSTYAPTISVIQTRNYVVKTDKKFVPTEIGELVNKVLTEHFPEIVDVGFTAKMEGELDEIAEGKISWQKVIGEFYQPFSQQLAKKYEEVSKKDLVKEEMTDEKCDKCGKPMVIKMGRFGKFLACSGFPECKSTKQLPKEPPKEIGMVCPKCARGQVVERRVNKGRARGKIFWGCSLYPKCDFATWNDPRKEEGNDKNTQNVGDDQ